jgi:DNA-binding transcriptional ArsR family regulator
MRARGENHAGIPCYIKQTYLIFIMPSSHRRTRSTEEKLDAVFHALSHRARRAVMARLAEGPASITQLAAPFSMSLPAVSQHIRVLEHAGLVTRRVDGRVHQCKLHALPLKSAQEWLQHYGPFWQQTLDALASYVEKR